MLRCERHALFSRSEPRPTREGREPWQRGRGRSWRGVLSQSEDCTPPRLLVSFKSSRICLSSSLLLLRPGSQTPLERIRGCYSLQARLAAIFLVTPVEIAHPKRLLPLSPLIAAVSNCSRPPVQQRGPLYTSTRLSPIQPRRRTRGRLQEAKGRIRVGREGGGCRRAGQHCGGRLCRWGAQGGDAIGVARTQEGGGRHHRQIWAKC